jgi:hypothetical protein
VFNIGNFTCEDNPAGHAGGAATITIQRPGHRDTWTRVHRLIDAVRAVPRRAGDRLFAINDTEAGWRGWQVIRECGGLARRYRDPMFDMITACASCLGSGADTGLPCLACLTCDGSGRMFAGAVT